MSKDLEYEVNNFANLLHKDYMNLMECLKKQSEDNKPILYLGKHYQKVILPYEEYQKMCNRLESIDNADTSEALELLGFMGNFIIPTALGDKHLKDFCDKEFAIIKNALLKAQKEHKALEIIKPSLRLVGNCLQAKAPFVDDYHQWVFIKEITDEEELKLLKGMLE